MPTATDAGPKVAPLTAVTVPTPKDPGRVFYAIRSVQGKSPETEGWVPVLPQAAELPRAVRNYVPSWYREPCREEGGLGRYESPKFICEEDPETGAPKLYSTRVWRRVEEGRNDERYYEDASVAIAAGKARRVTRVGLFCPGFSMLRSTGKPGYHGFIPDSDRDGNAECNECKHLGQGPEGLRERAKIRTRVAKVYATLGIELPAASVQALARDSALLAPR